MSKIYLDKTLNTDMTKLHCKKKCNVQIYQNETLDTYRHNKTALQKKCNVQNLFNKTLNTDMTKLHYKKMQCPKYI